MADLLEPIAVRRGSTVVVLLAVLAGGCGRSPAPPRPQPAGDALRGAVHALPDVLSRDRPVNEADVHFMTGMIAHHAQAVVMAGWAPSHGASDAVQRFCARIVVGQADEIRIMQDWLERRGQPVPDPLSGAGSHGMAGMDHGVLMPGMLTAAQMAELDAARGREFDRLFLEYMIMHHEGALTMVGTLFDSVGAAQDDVVFKFANDVFADQTSEITRMQSMLEALSGG